MAKKSTAATRISSRSASKVNTKQVNNTKVLAKTKKVVKAKNTKVAQSGKSGKTKISKAPLKGKNSTRKSESSQPVKKSTIKGKTSGNRKIPLTGLSKQKNATPATKRAEKTEKVPKVAQVPSGYTSAEFEKYKEEKIRLSKLNNAEMKAILKKNLQSMSGNKDELIEKIADGIVLGRIPRCPSCYGGRPKFDKKTGKYTCPGYRDDVEYQNCHKIFEKSDLKRDPWEA